MSNHADAKYTTVDSSDVRVGDTLETWWRPGRDIVTAIDPYTGPLEELHGGFIFRFAICPGCTAEPGGTWRRLEVMP